MSSFIFGRLCTAAGTLLGTAALGWVIAHGDGGRVVLSLLIAAGLLLALGIGALLKEGKLEEFADGDGRGLVAVASVGLMLAVGARADDASLGLADRILIWAFVVFAVGLSELFALFVVSAIRGRIDLAKIFLDKSVELRSPAPASRAAGETEEEPKPTVSLSRLQAFAWTLVVMIVYFHRVATNRTGDLPGIPPELLMVMGISGAVYLTSKEMGNRAQLEAQKPNEAQKPAEAQKGKGG